MSWWSKVNVIYVVNFINHINVCFSKLQCTSSIIMVLFMVAFYLARNENEIQSLSTHFIKYVNYISTFLTNNFNIVLHHCGVMFSKAPSIEHAPLYNACHCHPWQHHLAIFPSILGTHHDQMGEQEQNLLHINL